MSRKSQFDKFVAFGIIKHHLEGCNSDGCVLLKGFPEANFLDRWNEIDYDKIENVISGFFDV